MEPTEENWARDRWVIQRLWSLRRLYVWQYLKRTWRFIKNPRLKISVWVQIGLIGSAYAFLLWAVTTKFGRPIGLLDNLTITNWEDRRSFGLSIAGAVAPLLAIIGYILSANRTKTMEADNKIKDASQRQEAFAEALKLIDSEGLGSVGAISIIEQLGCFDLKYTQSAKDTLLAFLQKRAPKAPADNAPPDNAPPDNAPPDKALPDNSEFKLHVEAALHGLFALQTFTRREQNGRYHNNIQIIGLDLSRLRIKPYTNVQDIGFWDCSLLNTDFSHASFTGTIFTACDLTRASLQESTFINSDHLMSNIALRDTKLIGTIISNTNFEGVSNLKNIQLIDCVYELEEPPKNIPVIIDDSTRDTAEVKNSIILSSPCRLKDIDFKSIPMDEVKRFWQSPGNDKYRPRDRDGNLIEVFYLDDPNLDPPVPNPRTGPRPE